MFRKNFFKALTVTIFIISFAFPALGAMSHKDFIELCKSGTTQQVSNAIKAGADVSAKDNDG